jgi:acetoin utilization protein AcuB
MLDHKIGALPVLDDGRLVGIVTETDIARAFLHMTASVTTGRH